MDPYRLEKEKIEQRHPIHNKMTRQQIIEAQGNRREELIKLYAKAGIRYLGGLIE